MKAFGKRAAEQGAAAVELALLSLVLFPTLVYALFMFDMTFAHIKSSEINRYAVWEMTALPLSDYQGSQHDRRFDAARQAVLEEVRTRYGDDLDGATPLYTGGVLAKFSVTSTLSLVTPSGGCPSLSNEKDPWLSQSQLVDAVFNAGRFNMKGRAWNMHGIRVEPAAFSSLPFLDGPRETFQPAASGGSCFPAWPPVMRTTAGLIVDTWDLKGPPGKGGLGDVAEVEGENCGSDYCKQVQRMSYGGVPTVRAGMKIAGEAIRAAGWTTLGFYRNPTNVVLYSQAIDLPNNKYSKRKVPVPFGVQTYYTNSYKEILHDSESVYAAISRRLGKYYLGCKQPNKPEGACAYRQEGGP